MKDYKKYLGEAERYLGEAIGEEPIESPLAQQPKGKDYQKLLNSNVIKLSNAMIKAREAAEAIGIAIKKGAVVQDKEELIAKIQTRARWMVEDILGKGVLI